MITDCEYMYDTFDMKIRLILSIIIVYHCSPDNYITVLIMLKIIPKLIHALFYGVDLIRTLIDFPCLAYFASFPYTFS